MDSPELHEHSGIRPGDLVTTWHKGYWRVEKITDEGPETPWTRHTKRVIMCYYVKVLTEKLGPVDRKYHRCCNIILCKKVTKEQIDELARKFMEGVDRITKLLEE